jgi:hypothetical protein
MSGSGKPKRTPERSTRATLPAKEQPGSIGEENDVR